MAPPAGVAGFYARKAVLVTGATGFMGKVLVEKLLRSCADVARVYVLLRHKRGRGGAERLEDFINCQVFDRLRDEQPGSLRKVRLISGDILKEDLALSDEDRRELQTECHVIFHCAACVRFDQKLKGAVEMNTAGTRRVLELASSMERLEVFLHVSTAYSHCHLEVLEERVYPAAHPADKVIDIVGWMDADTLDAITPKMIAPQPNTYAYTKCLTESLVASYCHKFPIVIARPSIVVAAWKEPIPGWVENLNGPTGLMVGAGKGVIRSMLCQEKYNADVIPVDIAINACLVLACKTALERSEEVQVCNIAENGVINPISWGRALEIGREHVTAYPFSLALWYPGGSFKSSRLLHAVAHLFLHLLPAYFIDMLLSLLGKKTFMVKVQKRITTGLSVLQYYTMKQWQFTNNNFVNLQHYVSRADAGVFYTDMSGIEWYSYLRDYVLGTREYCCKEDPATLPSARRLQKRLYYVDKATQALVYAITAWFLYTHVHLVKSCLDVLTGGLLYLSPLHH